MTVEDSLMDWVDRAGSEGKAVARVFAATAGLILGSTFLLVGAGYAVTVLPWWVSLLAGLWLLSAFLRWLFRDDENHA